MLSEEQGIKAIIALQALAGIEEPEERAKISWQNFSEQDKISTQSAHRIVCGGFPDKEN